MKCPLFNDCVYACCCCEDIGKMTIEQAIIGAKEFCFEEVQISLTKSEVKELLGQFDLWTGGCRTYFKLRHFLKTEAGR